MANLIMTYKADSLIDTIIKNSDLGRLNTNVDSCLFVVKSKNGKLELALLGESSDNGIIYAIVRTDNSMILSTTKNFLEALSDILAEMRIAETL